MLTGSYVDHLDIEAHHTVVIVSSLLLRYFEVEMNVIRQRLSLAPNCIENCKTDLNNPLCMNPNRKGTESDSRIETMNIC